MKNEPKILRDVNAMTIASISKEIEEYIPPIRQLIQISSNVDQTIL